MIAEVQELYAYNRWANRRVLDTAERLSADELSKDLGSSFASVQATLVHILSSEWIWLSRWRGTSPTGAPKAWDLSTLDAVRARWQEVEAGQAEFVKGLSKASLSEVLEYKNLQGQTFREPLGQMLRHVVNHSTYHRGQIATLIRQLGHTPVSTDLIRFYREGGGAPGS